MSELLERRNVSRKTPRDGKHEITPETAARLRAVSPKLDLVVDGVADTAAVASMPCTCQGPTAHEHWFLESNALRSLEVGREVALWLAGDGRTLEVRTP
ncbi:MAG: hypothetical protein ACT4PJ_09865 [Gemmatimonadaceae bacterium]